VTDHVVTAHGATISHPYIIATERSQRAMLVDLALSDPGRTGVAARTHARATFYVWDRPVGIGQGAPRRFLQVGFFARFGAALFYHDPRPPTDLQSVTTEDSVWIALRPEPMADVPMVYFDQESGTQFPPAAVMPLDELRELVLEWCNSSEWPSSVPWLTVNSLSWTLTDHGDIAAPGHQQA
jgi:hypothetical protein